VTPEEEPDDTDDTDDPAGDDDDREVVEDVATETGIDIVRLVEELELGGGSSLFEGFLIDRVGDLTGGGSETGADGDEEESGFFATPLYAGTAFPGSVIEISLFDADGFETYSYQTGTDVQGNWVALLQGVDWDAAPIRVEVTVTPPNWAPASEQGAIYEWGLRFPPAHLDGEVLQPGSAIGYRIDLDGLEHVGGLQSGLIGDSLLSVID